jgi:hypothetical protein
MSYVGRRNFLKEKGYTALENAVLSVEAILVSIRRGGIADGI